MKKFLVINFIILAIGLACTSPVAENNSPSTPPTASVTVIVDTQGLMLDVRVQAVGNSEIVQAEYNGSRYIFAQLPHGEWRFEAFGRLFGQTPIFYKAENQPNISSDQSLTLQLQPFKVLTPYADKENNSQVAPGELIRLYTDTPQSQIFYTLNGSVPTNTPIVQIFFTMPIIPSVFLKTLCYG